MKKILILLVSMPLLVSCTIGKIPVTTEGTKDTVNASSQNAVMEGSITTPEQMIREESHIPLINLKATTPPLNPLEIK